MAIQELCDLCGRDALEKIYQPADSGRGLSVYLCTHCGLCQSLPRIDHVGTRNRAVSAGADWGNVRYGKGFRAAAAIARLGPFVDWDRPLSILDVGANRGAFLDAVLAIAKNAAVTAVEPDASVTESYRNRPNVVCVPARIEATDFAAATFDIVHSSHTLEHVASPSRVLADHRRTLKSGGLLFIEVPNLEMIGASDIVEEWFIDKHLYHYLPNVLAAQLEAEGFSIVSAADSADLLNITVLARKTHEPRPLLRSMPREVEAAEDLIATYKATRSRTRNLMRRVAAEIEGLAPRRVAVWGAGRLLDSLVSDGGYDPARAAALVDAHLARHGHRVCDRAVEDPSVLRTLKPDVVVVMSRAFLDEIRDEARKLVPGCEIVGYGDLMRAHTQAARP